MSNVSKVLPVFVIIPVHNRLNDTKLCLLSMRSQSYSNIRIIVVDDGSTDDTANYIREHDPNVILLSGDGNLWWTGAVAKGVEHVLSEMEGRPGFALILNNDVTFSDDLVELLVQNALSNGPAIVNALAIDTVDRKTCVTSGAKILSWFLNLSRHPFNGQDYSSIERKNAAVDMLSGRSLLIPLQVFQEIGNFDERRFPHYGGDNEFTWRARKKGWPLLIVPSACVYVETKHTGLNPDKVRMSTKQAFESLFSMRSANNLRIRTRFAVTCAPWYAVPTYMLVMLFKIFMLTFVLNYRRR